MPLSEHEQRILDEIEKHLHEEDPGFARPARRVAPRRFGPRNLRIGALAFLCGIGLLLGFFVSRSLIVGVLAFGAMVGGIVLMAGSFRGPDTIRSERAAEVVRRWESRIRNRYRRD